MGSSEKRGDLRDAAIHVDPDALDAACHDFQRQFPKRSAKRVLTFVQIAAFMLIAAALIWAARHDAPLLWRVLSVLAGALFAVSVLWRIYGAARLEPVLSRLPPPPSVWPVYTILCPLYREGVVALDLLRALARLDYPVNRLDIKLLIEADDVDTMTAALAAAPAPHIEIVILPPAAPRTKPKALNAGLARARGEFIVVYDAEDRPNPLQLRAALAAFEDGGADLACVQAPLAIDNAGASWIARQFAVEYAIQFRETLPLLARLGLPLPLGGSSNHFRIDALRDAGGWDPHNVTEDIDLGYRLAREGWRSQMIAPVTWEEAPITFTAWRKQRARWIKGHVQTWLVLMRNPARSLDDLGARAFWSMQLVLGCGVAASFLHAPMAALVLWAILSPDNILGGAGFVLALSGYCSGAFAALSAAAVSGDATHLRAAPTMPFYWPLSTIAAAIAAYDLLVRPHHWAKTTHGVSVRITSYAPSDEHDALSMPAAKRA